MEERNYAAEAILLIGTGIFAIIAGVIVLFMVLVNNSSAYGIAVVPIVVGSVFVIWGKAHKEKYVGGQENVSEGKRLAKKWVVTFFCVVYTFDDYIFYYYDVVKS